MTRAERLEGERRSITAARDMTSLMKAAGAAGGDAKVAGALANFAGGKKGVTVSKWKGAATLAALTHDDDGKGFEGSSDSKSSSEDEDDKAATDAEAGQETEGAEGAVVGRQDTAKKSKASSSSAPSLVREDEDSD